MTTPIHKLKLIQKLICNKGILQAGMDLLGGVGGGHPLALARWGASGVLF